MKGESSTLQLGRPGLTGGLCDLVRRGIRRERTASACLFSPAD